MINIINQTNYIIYKRKIIKVIKLVLVYLDIKNPEISVVFIGRRRMQALNKIYRQQSMPTDILSFTYDYQEGKLLDGEIFICYNLLVKQAHQYQHSVEEELTKLLVHGLLHLIGYDHQTINQAKLMNKLEGEIINYLSMK